MRRMRFEWTDLQVFLQVCEAGSMTRAATRCHLTLAAVSSRIRNLEEVNAIVLLVRHARGVSPTAAGEVLARHARTVLDQVQLLDRELLHAQNEAPRLLVLLANSSALAGPLAEGIAELVAPLAERPLLVRESASEATVQALRSGSADVGIVSDAVETRGLLARELAPDPLVLVVPRQHPFATRTRVRFAEALTQPWVAWGEVGALSTHLQMHALALGARIQAQTTFPTVHGVLRLVAAGAGITVLPQSVLARWTDSEALARVTLEEAWAKRRLLVCRPEDGNALRSHLTEEIAKRWQQRVLGPSARAPR
jgi:DNA-binding transcriptional LysR family regulator